MKGIKFFKAFFWILGIGSVIGAISGATHQLAITAICIIAIIVMEMDITTINQTTKN